MPGIVCFAAVSGQLVLLDDFIILGTPTGDVILNCHGQVPSELAGGTIALKVTCELGLPTGDVVEAPGTFVATQSGQVKLSCRWPGALVGVF